MNFDEVIKVLHNKKIPLTKGENIGGKIDKKAQEIRGKNFCFGMYYGKIIFSPPINSVRSGLTVYEPLFMPENIIKMHKKTPLFSISEKPLFYPNNPPNY